MLLLSVLAFFQNDVGISHGLSAAGGIAATLLAHFLIRRGGVRVSFGNNGRTHPETSGEKPPDYWDRRFDASDQNMSALTKVLERQEKTMDRQTEILEGHSKMLTEAVTLLRARGRK